MNELVKVTGGRFLMGRGLLEVEILELPRSRKIRGGKEAYRPKAEAAPPPVMTEVSVGSFWIGRYPVTQAEWEAVTGSNPAHFKDPNRPIESITWPMIIDYCNQRSLKEGLAPCYSQVNGKVECDFTASGYRLPTEAEWEYAARGGEQGRGYIFPGGNDANAVAWHASNAKNQTHPVGQKEPNEIGLYDLAGQVWEFCWDLYQSGYIPEAQSPIGPKGPVPGVRRVVRGGCYKNSPHLLFIGHRIGRSLRACNDHLGFRVVRTDLP